MPIPQKLKAEFEAGDGLVPQAPSSPRPDGARSPRARSPVPEAPSSPRPDGARSPRAQARPRSAMLRPSETCASLDSQPSNISKRSGGYHTSQMHFENPDQTIVVFDFDDTLFPTTFVDKLSDGFDKGTLGAQELKEFLGKIDQCQSSAETLLKSAMSRGQVIIVTLCSRGLLKKRCETWYSRAWKIMQSDDEECKVVYARESEVHQSAAKNQSKEDETLEYWAFVKGNVIEQELTRFYSQYSGQSWKNVISIGDSNIERYGMLGASSAYVQKRFSDKPKKAHQTLAERKAYANIWDNFDSKDPQWRKSLEGVHNGHVFKVRVKVVKMLEEPTPDELCRQQRMLSTWFGSITGYDGCLNLLIDDLRNVKVMKELETGDPIDEGDGEDDFQLALSARVGSSSLAFTGIARSCTMQSL